MKIRLHKRLLAFILVICLFTANLSSVYAQQKAGDKFEHVAVLHEMPADQMGKVMNIMSEALGVSCTHCHAGYDFAREDVAMKTKAREMLSMTLKLNQEHFGGRVAVSCATCHQGKPTPIDPTVSATGLAQLVASRNSDDASKIEGDKAQSLSVQQILRNYATAVRLADAPKQSSITWQAKRIEPNGKQEAEEIVLEGTNTWQQTTQYGSLAIKEQFVQGVAKKWSGTKPIELKPDEAAQIRIQATLDLGIELSTLFQNWTTRPSVQIGNRKLNIIRAVEADLTHEFAFDRDTSLLHRRTTSIPTILGGYVVEVTYEDYQPIAGRLRPTKTHHKMPSVSWHQEVTVK